MEYHKHRYTPLDRIDETLLSEILRSEGGCQYEERKHPSRSVCGTSGVTGRETRDTNKRCGERNQTGNRCDREGNKYNREVNRCGCGGNRRNSEFSRCEREGNRCDHGDNRCETRDSGNYDGNSLTCELGCGDFDNYKLPDLHGNPLSMVYSPHQKWGNLYEAEHGHSRGTIFKCLDFPFYGASCRGSSSCGCKYR